MKYKNIKKRALLAFVSFLLACGLWPVSPVGASTPYTASAVVGQEAFADGRRGPKSVGAPYGVTIDTVRHRMFVSDQFYHRVFVYDLNTSNQLTDKKPDYVLGQADFYGLSSHGGQTGFASPQDLYADSAGGRLFVADYSNNRVLIFDISGTITNNMNAVAVLGQPDFTTVTAGTTAGKMDAPSDIALDAVHHRLFVVDTDNSRVLVFNLDSSNNLLDTTADNVLGQAVFTANTADTNAKGFSRPTTAVYDATNDKLYVADKQNSRVLLFDTAAISDNEDATHVLGQPDFITSTSAATQSKMYHADGLALDESGHRLFVAEGNNYRVTVFNLDGSNVPSDNLADAVLGQPDYTSTSSSGSGLEKINGPQGLHYDPANNLLYAPNFFYSRVSIFDVTSITNGEAGVDMLGQSEYPSDVAVDTINHRLFVAESLANRILVYNLDSSNNMIDTTPDYVLGQSTFLARSPATTQSGLNCTTACTVAFDSERNFLYVGDSTNGRVMVFNLSGGITNGMNASNVLGKANFTASTCGPVSQNNMCALRGGLAYDQTNKRLFVAESSASRVMVFDLTAVSDHENATHVLGQSNFTSNTTGLSSTLMDLDFAGLAYDPAAQRLFVSDITNSRVMVFDANPATITNGEAASFVLGQANFTSGGSAVTQSGMAFPQALALDAEHRQLFVYEWGNQRITIFDIDSLSNGENAVGVLGRANFTTGGSTGSVSQTALDSDHTNMGFDPTTRRLYVPDSANHRTLSFDFASMSTSVIDDGVIGESYSKTIASTGVQGTATYSMASGSLPDGLGFDAATHTISGTPTATGTFNFAVQVTDVNGAAGTFTDTQAYVLDINHPPASGGSGGGTSSSTAVASSRAVALEPSAAEATSEDGHPEAIELTEPGGFFDDGQTIVVDEGDSVQFCLMPDCTGDGTYKASIDEINETGGSITISIGARQHTLFLNQPQYIDVTNNGAPDIQVTLTHVQNKKATVTFKYVAAATQTTGQPQTSSQGQSSATLAVGEFPWWLIITITVVVALAVAAFWFVHRRRNSPPPFVGPQLY